MSQTKQTHKKKKKNREKKRKSTKILNRHNYNIDSVLLLFLIAIVTLKL